MSSPDRPHELGGEALQLHDGRISSRMRLLFICQEIPYPPTNGVRLKLFNLLSFISRHHDCDVLGFSETAESADLINKMALEANPLVLGTHGVRRGPVVSLCQLLRFSTGRDLPSSVRWTSSNFADAVRRAVHSQGYHVVHFDMVNMWGYRFLTPQIPGVLSINDSISRFFELSAYSAARNMWSRRAALRLARIARKIEHSCFAIFDAVHVVSREEREQLESRHAS